MATVERLHGEQFVFNEAGEGFHIALVGVGAGRNGAVGGTMGLFHQAGKAAGPLLLLGAHVPECATFLLA
ncbi:MAG: hypothetical protein N2255_05655 [Kiritimatiellae bacterium]|nr:hypothetical protein [Kiritimatiellia bacterium]